MAALRAEEEWARQVVAHALSAEVVQHDDGSLDGMYDFDIRYPTGQLAVAEVTSAADGESIVLWNLLNGKNERWIEPELEGGWMVTLAPSSRAKRVRKDLPRFLEELEVGSMRHFDARDRRVARRLQQTASALGVARADQSGTDFPGSIYITIELLAERAGGMVADTGDALEEWVSAFLSNASLVDVREKLSRFAALERHVVVILPGFAEADFAVTDLLMRKDPPLPTRPPSLPREVTHIWAMSTWSTGRGIRWSPEQGWTYFDKLI